MRTLSLLTLPFLALAACGDGKSSETDRLDSSAIRTGGATGATTTTTITTTTASTSGAPTEDDVKALITRRAEASATGIGSSHSHVELEFQSVDIAPGREVNQQDRIDGIRGDTAWPVRARWIEHRRWGAAGAGGSTEDVQQYYSYDFYRNSFGDWDISGNGPVT